jgi:hypothetical protein
MRDPDKRPRNGQELIEVAHREWKKLDWRLVDGIIEKKCKNALKKVS